MSRKTLTDDQERLRRTAQAMLDGDIPYLAGAIALESYRETIGAYENDPDFVPFIAILSEIDQIGLGRNFRNWTPEVIRSDDFQASTKWAKEISLEQCRSLTRRYAR